MDVKTNQTNQSYFVCLIEIVPSSLIRGILLLLSNGKYKTKKYIPIL